MSVHNNSQDEDKNVNSSLSCFMAEEDDSSFDYSEVGKQDKARKKHKSTLFGQYGRSDIVYKTILRTCRKHYLSDFNESTAYIKTKRNKKPHFLLDKLAEYVNRTFPSVVNGSELYQELIFFLGSMFYNKHLKKCYASNTKKKTEIDDIHSSLYKFTIQRLATLENYGSYNFLMRDFMNNHRERVLEESKTLGKAKNDFTLGFGEIEKRLRQ